MEPRWTPLRGNKCEGPVCSLWQGGRSCTIDDDDKSKEFMGEATCMMQEVYNVKRKPITTLNPEAYSIVVRCHKTLHNHLHTLQMHQKNSDESICSSFQLPLRYLTAPRLVLLWWPRLLTWLSRPFSFHSLLFCACLRLPWLPFLLCLSFLACFSASLARYCASSCWMV